MNFLPEEKNNLQSDVLKLWAKIVGELENLVDLESLEIWLHPIKPISFQNGILTLSVPNQLYADRIQNQFESHIMKLISQIVDTTTNLQYILQQTNTVYTPLENIVPLAPTTGNEKPVLLSTETIPVKNEEFSRDLTFETFVVGRSNRFVHAVCERAAKEPGKVYNPVFLYGGVGLGKTHLLYAIKNFLRAHNPVLQVLYVTCERFVNDFIDCLRNERINDFRLKYRRSDCLLIDDIQFLVGKQGSQEEFFYIFNSLFDDRKQIVISSDCPPRELQTVGERLTSRFEWGVLADIQPPDFEHRVAILRTKAERDNVTVSDDVLRFIAEVIQTNIRQLEGALNNIVAYAAMTGTDLSVDSAKYVLRNYTSTEGYVTTVITFEHIQNKVAQYYHLPVEELRSERRSDAIAFPRQIAMYLTRTLTGLSTTEIGRAFGGRDHTTVLHACNKIKARMLSDPYFVELINRITKEIESPGTKV